MTLISRPPLSWLDTLSRTVEEKPWTPWQLASLIAAVVVTRNVFEIAVADNPVFQGLALFLHYPLAYVAPFLALVLVLAFFARLAPLKVARVMSVAWTLTLLPPLFDLLVHRGVGRPAIGYLRADPADLAYVFVHFFDPTVALTGTTAGIRLEALIAVLAGALFVWIRSRSWLRALLAAPAIYLCSLFFFTLPTLVAALFRFLLPGTTVSLLTGGQAYLLRPSLETSGDSVAIFWLVPLVLVLELAWRRLDGAREASGARASEARTVAALYAGVLLVGLTVALMLHFPPGTRLQPVAFDFLAPLGALLALGLGASLALNPRCLVTFGGQARAALFLALSAGLGRSVTAGLLVALVPLLLLGLDLLPAGWPRRFANALIVPLGAVGAVLAGVSLVLADEGIARMPAFPFPAIIAVAFAVGATLEWERPAWLRSALAAFALAIGVAISAWSMPEFESSRVLAMTGLAAVFAAGAVLLGVFVESVPWSGLRRLPVATLVLALVLVVSTRALIEDRPAVRKALHEALRGNARLHVVMGLEHQRRGNWGGAIDRFKLALASEPEYAEAARLLGLAHMQRGNKERAEASLRRALELGPESVSNVTNLAALFLETDRPGEALVVLDALPVAHRRDAAYMFNRAAVLDALGMVDEARQAWEEFRTFAEGRPDLRSDLTEARRRLRKLGATP